MLAKEYDELWTPERLTKVIDAAARNGVAIEISNRLHLPKPAFIKQAKAAGIKFTFGTNNVDCNLGRDGVRPEDDPGVRPDPARFLDAQARRPEARAGAEVRNG